MGSETLNPGDPAAGVQEKGGSSSDSQDVDPGPKSEVPSDTEAAAINGDAPQKTKKSLAFHLSFIAITFLSFLFSLDATTQAVALPVIAEQLHGTTLQSFWANIGYLLCVVVTLPLYTAVSDVFGRKPTLYFGIFLFALGSLVFAIAQNMVTVVVGRVLQGIGGGGMDLMSEIIVADMTTLQERSLYLGLLAIPTAIGSILGPTLGALFTANVSWRWIGWINLPILGVSLFLIVVFLRLRPIDSSIASKLKRVDWGGSFLSLAGITLFVVPLSWANSLYPWRAWETLVPLLIGAALVFAFMMYEFKVPKQPIFPLRLFHSRTVHLTLLGNFAYGASLYSVLQYLPLFYQAVTLRTAIGAAVTLLPTSIVSVVFAVGGVIMVGVLGKGYVWAIIMYWVILTVGSGLLGLLGENSSASMLLGLPILWSSAIGALMRLLHLPLQASVSSVDDTGLVIGLLLVVRLLGGVVGLAMSSSIFNSVFEASTRHLDLMGPLAPLRDASQAVSFIPQLLNVNLPPETLDPVLQAYATAMRAIFYTMTGFSGVGLLTALFTQDVSLKRTELGRQRFEN